MNMCHHIYRRQPLIVAHTERHCSQRFHGAHMHACLVLLRKDTLVVCDDESRIAYRFQVIVKRLDKRVKLGCSNMLRQRLHCAHRFVLLSRLEDLRSYFLHLFLVAQFTEQLRTADLREEAVCKNTDNQRTLTTSSAAVSRLHCIRFSSSLELISAVSSACTVYEFTCT